MAFNYRCTFRFCFLRNRCLHKHLLLSPRSTSSLGTNLKQWHLQTLISLSFEHTIGDCPSLSFEYSFVHPIGDCFTIWFLHAFWITCSIFYNHDWNSIILARIFFNHFSLYLIHLEKRKTRWIEILIIHFLFIKF